METARNLWSAPEERVLIEEYNKVKDILQSKLNNKVTVHQKKLLWNNIAVAVSALGDSCL